MGRTDRPSPALRMAARLWWMPLVALGVLLDRGSRVRWLLTPAIVVAAACASTTGKLIVRRPRPGARGGTAPLGRLGAAGFPSTHAACAFAIAGWHSGSRQGRWLHLVAVGIGYLRVRRGAHYYGDVAAGAILGYGLAWQAEGVRSRLVALPSARTAKRAVEQRSVSALEPRPVVLPALLRRRRRLRGAVFAAVGHEVSIRLSGRRNGAVPSREGLESPTLVEVS